MQVRISEANPNNMIFTNPNDLNFESYVNCINFTANSTHLTASGAINTATGHFICSSNIDVGCSGDTTTYLIVLTRDQPIIVSAFDWTAEFDVEGVLFPLITPGEVVSGVAHLSTYSQNPSQSVPIRHSPNQHAPFCNSVKHDIRL